MERRARIVATLGPASSDAAGIAALLRAGADVFRLNLSHGSRAEHRATLARVRGVAARLDRHVPVLVDLMGPRFRLGTLAAPRTLKRGERVTLGAAADADLPVDDPGFLAHVRVGERILIADGLVELVVAAKSARRVAARVVDGGTVATRKGINLPDSRLPFTISAKDRADIAFAVAAGADYLGGSYIGRARDVEALRELVRARGGDLPIVAKIERAVAIEHLEEITAAADAVMVARGDLGVEVPLHRVPVLQKRIVTVGRRLGRPVIVATQMLESMIAQPRPTRAESSDVANAVFDGADALMLSGETAVGRFPVEAVRTMARIVVEAESYALQAGLRAATPEPPTVRRRPARADAGATEIADVLAAAAVQAAGQLPGSRLVAFSQGGFTARRLARRRPVAPILVFTTDERVARRIRLLWGTHPIRLARDLRRRADLVRVVERELLARRLIRRGECLVLLMGHPVEDRPLTNLLRIHRVPGR
jgi:pyruvate kinase